MICFNLMNCFCIMNGTVIFKRTTFELFKISVVFFMADLNLKFEFFLKNFHTFIQESVLYISWIHYGNGGLHILQRSLATLLFNLLLSLVRRSNLERHSFCKKLKDQNKFDFLSKNVEGTSHLF